MALYNMGSLFQRGTNQFQGAEAAMGKQTREGPRTEIEPAPLTGSDIVMNGLALYGTGKQLYELGGKAVDGYQWLANKFGAPNAAAQAINTGAGAQAAQQAGGTIQNGVQLNTGAQISAEDLQNFFYEDPAQKISDAAYKAAIQDTPGNTAAATGSVAANASNSAQSATQAAQGGMSGMGAVVGPAVGGVAGGLAGREIGKAIGGNTGGQIGSVAGSLGGAYLGGLAASTLASTAASTAAGMAGGATAGSFVPGYGTLIGAGIGALSSFFL